ncbi:MAG: uncharacterized protein RL079_704 [Verrucomicrobiota bacterium]|jgi:hypothetical protein
MRLLHPAELGAEPGDAGNSSAALYVRNWSTKDHAHIGNLETEMLLLDTGTHQFPVSVNRGEGIADNCYVVSPLAAYGAYAQEEVKRMNPPQLRRPLAWLLRGVSALLRSIHADRTVQINNWLLSTNLYPDSWEGADLPEITALLAASFPQYTFTFRSLNPQCNGLLLMRLKALGYVSIPSRQVYIFDGRAGDVAAYRARHDTRKDAALLARSRYRVRRGDELKDEDFERLEQLYNLLYLEKYCHLNPHYKAEWLRRGHQEGWLQLRVLQSPEGRIDGVVGWFATEATLSAPIVGYDTALPIKLGLYRQLTQLCFQEAAARRIVLNFSSGAPQFKRMRGGQPQIEVSMVYVKHLPWKNRIIWGLLGLLMRTIAAPVMKALKV